MSARAKAAAEAAADWWAERLQSGDVKVFRDTLSGLVEADLERDGESLLSCDYDPEGHLLSAVRAAGIECRGCLGSAEGILPMKHQLRVHLDRLEPKEGYGNWLEPIPLAIAGDGS